LGLANDGDEQAYEEQSKQSKAKAMTLSLSLSLSLFCFCVVVGGEFHAWKQKTKKGNKRKAARVVG
jgi:predicted small integral membrane protein